MSRPCSLVGLVLLVAAGGGAQTAGTRAWQQRLQVEVPLPAPRVELEATNPFDLAVDLPPQLLTAEAPRRVDVAGVARVAVHVDANGRCSGAVPLELPFSGVTAQLVGEFARTRFEPARSGKAGRPSWVVVEVSLAGKVRESTVIDQLLELPDPSTSPLPRVPSRMAVPASLRDLPAAAAAELSSLATPRRASIRVPARELEVPVRALVRISAHGRCDRYVPLELDPGLEAWLSAYLASWQLEPAQRGGAGAESWMMYTARVRVDLSSLESSSVRVLGDQVYDPRSDG